MPVLGAAKDSSVLTMVSLSQLDELFFFFLSVLLLRLNDFYKNYDIIKQVMQVQHKQKSTVLA